MKRKYTSPYSIIIFLFVLTFIPDLSFAALTTFQIRLRLETAGLNNALIEGSVEGDFTLSDKVAKIDLKFDNQTDQFEFSGDGGFVSLAGEPKRLRKQIRSTFRASAIDYLQNGIDFNVLNTTTLIGSFVSADKTRLVCSSFGIIDPVQDIVYGQYQLTLSGTKENNTEVLNAQGTVNVVFLPIL